MQLTFYLNVFILGLALHAGIRILPLRMMLGAIRVIEVILQRLSPRHRSPWEPPPLLQHLNWMI